MPTTSLANGPSPSTLPAMISARIRSGAASTSACHAFACDSPQGMISSSAWRCCCSSWAAAFGFSASAARLSSSFRSLKSAVPKLPPASLTSRDAPSARSVAFRAHHASRLMLRYASSSSTAFFATGARSASSRPTSVSLATLRPGLSSASRSWSTVAIPRSVAAVASRASIALLAAVSPRSAADITSPVAPPIAPPYSMLLLIVDAARSHVSGSRSSATSETPWPAP